MLGWGKWGLQCCPNVADGGSQASPMHICINKGQRTDCGWPQWPSAASAPGRSMFHARLGVANIEPEAAGGAAPNVAGMGVYPAVACFAPICHKNISPVALPASRDMKSVLVFLDQRLGQFTEKGGSSKHWRFKRHLQSKSPRKRLQVSMKASRGR